MSDIFKVSLRRVSWGDTILPDDHNNKVDAFKELVNIAVDTVIYMITTYGYS